MLIRCTAQYQSTFPTLGHHYFRGWPHKGGIDVSPSILLEPPPHFWFSIQQTFTTKEILVSRMSNTVVVVFPEKGLKIDFPCGRRARPNADHCWGGSSQVPQPTLWSDCQVSWRIWLGGILYLQKNGFEIPKQRQTVEEYPSQGQYDENDPAANCRWTQGSLLIASSGTETYVTILLQYHYHAFPFKKSKIFNNDGWMFMSTLMHRYLNSSEVYRIVPGLESDR